jgi:O-antigen/teichoic acid export membrane protein
MSEQPPQAAPGPEPEGGRVALAEPIVPPAGGSQESALPTRSVTGLADRAAQGFALMAAQTVFVRLIRFGGIFVLTWLLVPGDFALFGYVLTVSQFTGVLRNAGVRDILIRRQHRARKWVNPGIWLTFVLGYSLSLLMIMAAPLVAEFYGHWQLVDLVIVMAIASVFQTLSQAPVGLLQGAMRFKLVATVEAVYNSMIMVLTVVFALMGMGALSFALPFLICAGGRTAVLMFYAKPRVSLNPQFRRWKYMFADSIRLMSADFARTISIQGDIVILGRVFPGLSSVGHYVYGNNISRQSMMLFSRNLDLVLFPTLSKIQQDTARQNAAFVRALRMLAVVGVPLCFLQAAVADPVIHTLVPERFYGAIPYIVLLSIGMAGRLMISPAESMLRGQGRFSMFSWLNWIFAALYTIGAIAGAVLWGDPIGVAVAIAVITGFGGALYVFVALNRSEHPLRATLRVFSTPVIAAGIACGSGWWLSTFIPRTGVVNGLLASGVVVAVTGLVYLPAVWMLERDVCMEFLHRIRGVVGSRLIGRVPGLRRIPGLGP